MTPRRVLATAAITAAAAGLVWLFFVGLPPWYGGSGTGRRAEAPPAGSTAPAPLGRKIKARLFYIAEDGINLTSVERDVTYGEGTVEQAKEIINAQIAPPTEPLVSAVPPGTTLRALFVTEQGEAYVDLSRDVAAAHLGGSLNELLTIYTFVEALTANLPAVSAVQVLVDGMEVDTLAGHVDLRRPLVRKVQ